MMFWILLCAIVGSTIPVIYIAWRKWIAPWRDIERLVRQVGRGEQPRTFIIDGAKEAQQVAIALENILLRQRRLERETAERTFEQRAIFSAMQDGLLVLDRERRIALFNRTFQELFGISDNSLGAPVLEAVREPSVEQLVSETFRKRNAARRELMLGQRQWQVNAAPLQRGNGEELGVVLLFHDISDLKRADQIRQDFVANVSHELRTPLSILRGYIEAMLDNPKMPRAESARILSVMEQHSKRLGLLANDLLTLAQLESGGSILQLKEIDLDRFFRDLVRDWKKKFAVKNLTAAVDVPSDFPIIRADETRLREVFDNLLDNAVKYSRKSGEVCVRAVRRGDEIMLSVSDDGIGINNEDLPRIFERFYRADKARSPEGVRGTGLGLSIVKHIAQLHGGRVEAESELGKGTTIRVSLPLVTQT